ncbi:hypothetical protein HBH70_181290 [Parastagonospora nodorum]|nr:hypothetical protein HBH50_019580 [Parastagonospora nodorum]KAH4098042.1 hypothetical protein HBH48_027730 [Parastagonospora nodorum]KAH4209286.1 hypothetical protein HBI95_088170 [Parastagonospora nodorum]KAH4255861.1 hypothetical protein HBI03_172910 [Parastagonospora nodorum]KAH4280814.1 hypothetical protein HBI04_048710 [Parastagonospora nodorum]
MGYSEPTFPLNGHCSVVHDGTLYVYSSAGFQSLKLEEGAEWTAMPMDISLSGAACVNAEAAGMMYIVGGAVNETTSTWNYPGLMHYTFKEKKWDWLRAESWNTQNRQNHGAVYLEKAKKLLIYSGSQTTGANGPSSETFLMSTVPPYTVESQPSNGAPPLVKPMLISMDDESALLVGGGAANTALWKFSIGTGWQDLGVALQQPIVNPEAVQCTVVSGKGKSRVLEKFDMSVTPNKVDRILLIKEDGTPAAPGATPGKAKRVTVDSWPEYNSTYAPTSARSGYSLAQSKEGLTVASGGNQSDPIVLFDAKENSWMNATALFSGQQVISNSVSSSSSPTSSPTSTPVSSTTPSSSGDAAVLPAAPDNKAKMMTVLGATLGTIFGIAAILILILMCLKYRKSKSKQSQGYVEKDRMSFADRGADFMKEAGGSEVTHPYNLGNDSHTSLAIIQGRGVNGHKKNMASDASTAGLMKKTSPLGYSDPVELSKFDLKPEPVNDKMVRQNSGRVPAMTKSTPRSRSSGWSRYFANNEATNLANVQADRSTYASDRTSTVSQSQYTNSRIYNQHLSQHVAPLQIPTFDGQRLSRVASGSPTLGSSTERLPHQVQPMQAELGRANSNGSTRSGVSYNEHYFRDPVESWTPVGENQRTSSAYTGSMVFDSNNNNKNDATSSYYPDGTDSFYPKSNFSSFYPGQGTTVIPDNRDSSNTMFPSGNRPAAPTDEMPKSKFSSMYPSPPRIGLPQERESTVTLFPGPNPSAAAPSSNNQPSSFYPAPRLGHESTSTMFPGPGGAQNKSKDGQSDMSWLNLGTGR